MVLHDWKEVESAVGSEAKATAYQKSILEAVERCFPLRKTRKKTTDLPWLSKPIKDQIRKRKGLYMEEGGVRTAAWKEAKKDTDQIIKKRKRGFLDKQKEHLLSEDANRNFYKHVKKNSKLEKPKQFDVRELLPEKTDKQVAEELAAYFNRISLEFDSLQDSDIPETFETGLPRLRAYEVATDPPVQKAKIYGPWGHIPPISY